MMKKLMFTLLIGIRSLDLKLLIVHHLIPQVLQTFALFYFLEALAFPCPHRIQTRSPISLLLVKVLLRSLCLITNIRLHAGKG